MILLKKAMRSIWREKKAYIACVALMAIGIAVYLSFNLLYNNLDAALNGMYAQQRFGDVFAAVRSMPLSDLDKFTEIPGIAKADAALVTDARVLVPDAAKVITLRVSSFDPEQEDRLNNFLVREGSLPQEDQLLVSDMFAAARGLEVGDPLSLVVEGRELTLIISGIVLSPEYIYAIPDTGQLLPDNEAFGYGYMSAGRLGVITGRAGAVTHLSFLLEEGVAFEAVRYDLEDALAPYGTRYLLPRKDQPSNAMLSQEIESLGAMASSIPMVLILMAVIILYIMLKRVIEQERTQIGVLKAFGFSGAAIVGHYMLYGGITGFAGGVLGLGGGLVMTGSMTDLYLEFFNLPAMDVPPNPVYLVIGVVIALGSGMAGALMGARGILKLLPSEAMRPPSPPLVKGDLLGKLPALRAMLSSYGFMATRNITRNKFRSAFVVVGIAFSFAIMAFMASYGDMFDAMLLDQFTKSQLYNLKLSLAIPAARTPALEAAWALEGVHLAEGILEVPAELRLRHLKKSIQVTAIEEGSSLYKIWDNEERRHYPVPENGVVISNVLARDLAARRGDLLLMRTPYTGDSDIPVPVLEVVHDSLGSTAYIELSAFCTLLDIPLSVSGLIMEVDDPIPIKNGALDAKNVLAATDQEETLKSYTDMLDTYSVMIYMMQLAGIGIAFAIITNTSSISLSERKREYATMRVLGMHPREIGQVVGFEYWTLTIAAFLPGVALTRLIKQSLAGIMDNELFTMPVSTSPQSFANAAVCCAVAVALSNWFATRKIARFDMVEVLKERE